MNGRERQSAVYVGGVSGGRPRVPVGFARLEEAAREAMSPEAYAYVAAGAGAEAEAHFDRLHVHRELPAQVEEAEVRPEDGVVHLPALIASAFGLSSSEARRLIGQGGVRVDGRPVDAGTLDLPAAGLDGAVLQVGKRRHRRLRLARP